MLLVVSFVYYWFPSLWAYLRFLQHSTLNPKKPRFFDFQYYAKIQFWGCLYEKVVFKNWSKNKFGQNKWKPQNGRKYILIFGLSFQTISFQIKSNIFQFLFEIFTFGKYILWQFWERVIYRNLSKPFSLIKTLPKMGY